MEASREARRRRLVERGSDRLAFITGQTRSLPDPPPPPAPPSSSDAPPSECDDGVASLGTAVEGEDRVELASSVCEISEELPGDGGVGVRTNTAVESEDRESVELSPSVPEKSREPLKHEIVSDVKFSAFTGSERSPQTSLHIFTPNGISNSISASENIRLLCAIVIGFLVVLTFGTTQSSSWASWVGKFVNLRPLFLVLLTDASIVVGHLLMTANTPPQRSGRRDEGGYAWDAGKMLEVGLVVQKAIRAGFMDCCICAVIIIAGLGA